MKAVLTDGAEVFKVREIDGIAELEELNRRATEATDGNLFWILEPEKTGLKE